MAFISSNTHAPWSCGKTVLSISRIKWVSPTQLFVMAQSLDASVSSLMLVRLVVKSVLDAELHVYTFLHDCTLILQVPN